MTPQMEHSHALQSSLSLLIARTPNLLLFGGLKVQKANQQDPASTFGVLERTSEQQRRPHGTPRAGHVGVGALARRSNRRGMARSFFLAGLQMLVPVGENH